jgi:hypothetical protein
MKREELEVIRKRAEAATPGPWYWEKLNEGDSEWDTEMPSLVSSIDEGVMHFGDCEEYYPTEGSPPTDEDAEFIAHAREDIPKLLAEIERLRIFERIFTKPVDLVATDEKGIAAKLYGVSINLPEGDGNDGNL